MASLASSDFVETLRRWLRTHGPATASAIGEALRVSQPTVSRALRQLGTPLIRLGKARATVYALMRPLEDVPAEMPIYRIDETGRAHRVAQLYSLAPEGFLCAGLTVQPLRTPDLPYFMDDVRPRGFLGRFLPLHYPSLQAPNDIRLWNATHCLRYLTRHGWDLPGDLLFGDEALHRYQQAVAHPTPVVSDRQRAVAYETLAADATRAGVLGSSAAGEQPKFVTRVGKVRTAVLVKFSPPRTDATSRRMADLLVCEHLAHIVLRDHGQSAPHSQIHVGPTRTFLEVERFDRIGAHGRRGVMSLTALDLGHEGILRSWWESASSLQRCGVITIALRDQIGWLEYFGHCIANTDMHGGNCSFLTDGLLPTQLAPVYDMLPMAYYPPHVPMLPTVAPPAPPSLTAAEVQRVWTAAQDFWTRVAADSRITATLRTIAKRHRAWW